MSAYHVKGDPYLDNGPLPGQLRRLRRDNRDNRDSHKCQVCGSTLPQLDRICHLVICVACWRHGWGQTNGKPRWSR